jgi:RHS repeat-associated protein
MTTSESNRPIEEVFGRHTGYAFAGDGVQTAIGNYSRTEVDLPITDGLLAWRRTYNSRDKTVGILGRGWMPAHAAYLDTESVERILFHDQDGRVLAFEQGESGVYRRPQDLDADLSRSANGAYALRFFCGETWQFDDSGRLLSWSHEGRRLSFKRDGDRLVALVHSAGFRLDLEYNLHGLLTRVKADDGRVVSYEYSGSMLTAVTGADAGVVRYEATHAERLVRIVDPDDVTLVANKYDKVGRVSHQDLAGVGGVDFEYDEKERRTEVTTTPTGARIVFEHDESARVTGVTDPEGNRTTYAYNDDGRPIEATLPSGAQMESSYDERGNLVKHTIAGSTTTYSYDSAHRPIESTDAVGATTRYGYEGASHIPTSVTDVSGARTRYIVEDGLVVASHDPDGDSTKYEYDRRRNLVAVVDATGQRTEYRYDAAGRRVSVTTPRSETTRYEYDDASRLVSMTDSAGGVTRFRYSAGGKLLETTDQDGAVSRETYDSAGRLSERTDRLGATTTYAYDATGNVSTIRLPNGVETTLEYDALNRLSMATEPDFGTMRYTYDADGNLTVEDGPEGPTRTEWDGRGNPVAITNPDGSVVRYDYDGNDRVTRFTDPEGAVWRTDYDDEGRSVTDTDPLGARTKKERTPGGLRSTVIDALGGRTRFHYDRAGRTIEVIDPEGGRTRYAYDGDGRRLSHTTPAGLVTRYEYEKGRLIAVIDPRGWITRFRYDKRGNRTHIIRPGGATYEYSYDEDGRLIRVTDPRGGVTRYEYNSIGNLTSVTDAKGAVTRYMHDKARRRISITDPLGRTTRREYDTAGNLAAIIEPSGRTIRMEYDSDGRLIRRFGEDGAEARYTYDKAGRRTSMTDATGKTRYEYDKVGRLVKVTEPDGGKLTAEYDKAGQRIELRYPDGSTVRYRYDLNGRLIELSDSEAGEAVYAVDPDGRLITEQLPGGWARRYHYDGGLLARFEEIRSAVPTTHARLSRDADGRITVQDDGDQEWRYGYDKAGQLVSIELRRADKDIEETHIGYDIVGNRTTLVQHGEATRYLYDIADQLIAVESNGRRIDCGYDSKGRLVEEHDGTIRHRIDYDGLGLPRETIRTRAWAIERLRSTYNGDGLLADLVLRAGDDAAPDTKVHYRWSVGERVPEILLQQVRTEAPQANHTAPIGRDLASARFTYGYGRTFASTRYDSVNFARDVYGSAVCTEQTRPWVQASAYDAFGLAESVEPDRAPLLCPEIPRFGYRGELAYGSMLNLRARTYDAALGRFTTRDPVSVYGASSLANHPYAYARNDPLNKVDPLGEQAGASCNRCPAPGNGIDEHLKCFQKKACLYTRGNDYFSQEALDADEEALKGLWYTKPKAKKEAAAHALTVHELNKRRRGFWYLGTDIPVNFNVDWEVGSRYNRRLDSRRFAKAYGLRVDIVTEERFIFEVKKWDGPSTQILVDNQLAGYEGIAATDYGINFDRSTELRDWADSFNITRGGRSYLYPINQDYVYVWGLGNWSGHIYFAEGEKAHDHARNKADAERAKRDLLENLPLLNPIGRGAGAAVRIFTAVRKLF